MERWRSGVLAVAITVLVGLVGWAFARSLSEDDVNVVEGIPRGPAPPCPYGFVDHPARGGGLVQGIRGTPDGAAVLEALGQTEVRYCFGETDHGMLAERRVLLLSSGDPDAVVASRIAHLLDHVTRDTPMPDPIPADADCDALVRQAIEREARAHAIEVRVRRALGVEEPRYEFERDMLAAGDEAAGERVIAAYLEAHPDGAPNVDALVSGYRERCAVATRSGPR